MTIDICNNCKTLVRIEIVRFRIGGNKVESFEETLERIEALITGRDHVRDFDAAYRLAIRATELFSAQPAAWSQLVLTANLTDRHSAALEAQTEANKQCSAWTNIDQGDCERDHALYSIRHRKFMKARRHIDAARKLHKGDADRSALLDMVDGQRWYGLKEYANALDCYLTAVSKWEALEQRAQTEEGVEPPRAQWRFNSDRRLLKAIIALQGARGEARELYKSLQERMPQYGSVDLAWRLRLVMTGRIGNWVDTRMESPLGRRILANAAPLAHRLLQR